MERKTKESTPFDELFREELEYSQTMPNYSQLLWQGWKKAWVEPKQGFKLSWLELEILGLASKPKTASEINEKIQAEFENNPSTVKNKGSFYRLLRSLVKRGYLEKHTSGPGGHHSFQITEEGGKELGVFARYFVSKTNQMIRQSVVFSHTQLIRKHSGCLHSLTVLGLIESTDDASDVMECCAFMDEQEGKVEDKEALGQFFFLKLRDHQHEGADVGHLTLFPITSSQINLRDNIGDVFIGTNTIGALGEVEARSLLEEIKRVLKPGSLIFLSERAAMIPSPILNVWTRLMTLNLLSENRENSFGREAFQSAEIPNIEGILDDIFGNWEILLEGFMNVFLIRNP